MRGLPIALVLLGLCGCASPLERGEARFAQGDPQGALELWEGIPDEHSDHTAAAARIAAVQANIALRASRHLEEAQRLEDQGRLAEALLGYRLALRLEAGNAEVLVRVQQLAREARRRALALQANYARKLATGDLENAWETLQSLRTLDPFEPAYESEERALHGARLAEWEARDARLRAQRRGEAETLALAALEAFREERLEEALELWQRALILDPRNERVQSYISRAERQLKALRALRALGDEQRDTRRLGPRP